MSVRRTFLVAVTAASLGLHLVRLSFPDRPVFDERHFATYAAAWAGGQPHVDIHPPLGKLLYAAVLLSAPAQRYQGADFLQAVADKEEAGSGTPSRPPRPDLSQSFDDFPYVRLRLLACCFGSILPLLSFALLARLTRNRFAPYLAAVFVLFENSLLMETRLILLNGMYLSLGMAALVLWLREPRRPLAAGVLFGLSLSVKPLAVAFLGPMLFSLVTDGLDGRAGREAVRACIRAVGAGLLTLAIVMVSVNALVPAQRRVEYYRTHRPSVPGLPASAAWLPPPVAAPLDALIREARLVAEGHASGSFIHPADSFWYDWPRMRGTFVYYPPPAKARELYKDRLGAAPRPALALVGNPFVWFSGTLAMSCAVLFTLWRWPQRRAERVRAFVILAGGYVWALAPFALLVRRSAFLYHYFPALILSILAAALIVGECLERIPSARLRVVAGASLIALAAAGFLRFLPFTLGL